MKRTVFIGLLLLLALASCHDPRRQARQMLRRAEQLFDTLPYSTASLINSVLRMPVYFEAKQRMDMALLQAEALFGDRGQEIPPFFRICNSEAVRPAFAMWDKLGNNIFFDL